MGADAGISAFPDAENLFSWMGTIIGADGTVYEGLQFKLSIKFTQNYPFNAPTVKFETPCFHPNVDQYGNICLDILKVHSFLFIGTHRFRTNGAPSTMSELFSFPSKVFWEVCFILNLSHVQNPTTNPLLTVTQLPCGRTKKVQSNTTFLIFYRIQEGAPKEVPRISKSLTLYILYFPFRAVMHNSHYSWITQSNNNNNLIS